MPVRHPEWEVSVQDVKSRFDAKEPFVLIDVREHDEFRFCCIEGAVHFPLDELPNRMADILELADGKPVITHCHHGGRSLRAASFLREAGIADARSMAGGIDEWACVIDPAVPRY